MVMEPRLDYERSLALHHEVGRLLIEDSRVLDRARAKLEQWIAQGGRSLPLLLEWRDVLARSPEEVAQFLAERSERAAWLRSASPFAGVLDPQTRRTILRAIRQQLESHA